MARTYEQEREHKWRRRGIHGVSYTQYEEMRKAQNYACAICGNYVNGNGALDHDHQTGEARGILCNTCNMALGHLEKFILSGHVSAYLQLSGKEEVK